MAYRLRRPGGCLIRMAHRARIGNLVFVGHCRSDETEGMGVNIHAGDFGLESWHMARGALAAGAALLVMRVLFEGGGAGAVG